MLGVLVYVLRRGAVVGFELCFEIWAFGVVGIVEARRWEDGSLGCSEQAGI